jgi:hypothetical protein
MTYTNANFRLPKVLTFKKQVSKANLIINGQGVILFNASKNCSLIFCDVSGNPGIKFKFTDTSVSVNMEPSNMPLVDTNNSKGLTKQNGAYYWVSIDSQNLRLFAGIGEARKETAIYEYQFTDTNNKENNKLFLESLSCVNIHNLQITTIIRDPITTTMPLLVKNTEDLTMDSIALSTYMPKTNLSTTSQKLYDCISGKQFTLNTPDFPDFVKAIEYSIATPGMWCYERIKQKATEFSKDKPNYLETYLRITLGENNGESPGIPYVLEIWPVGHYSPVHNHGSSSAIIRVLNGAINVSLFPFLSNTGIEPFAKANFKKDDITWISPTLNQVHQLKNLDSNKDTCITIQCYMYEYDNTSHYDYFDYTDPDNIKIQQFEPDSDMEYIKFKKTIRGEWLQRKCSWFCC